jgi:hypothetical protein
MIAGDIGSRTRHPGLYYSANTYALQELLGFLYAECCMEIPAKLNAYSGGNPNGIPG